MVDTNNPSANSEILFLITGHGRHAQEAPNFNLTSSHRIEGEDDAVVYIGSQVQWFATNLLTSTKIID